MALPLSSAAAQTLGFCPLCLVLAKKDAWMGVTAQGSQIRTPICKLAVSSSHKHFPKSSSSSRNSSSLSKLPGYWLRTERLSWQTAGAWLMMKSCVLAPFEQEEDSKYSSSFSLPSQLQPGFLKNRNHLGRRSCYWDHFLSYIFHLKKEFIYISCVLPVVESWNQFRTFQNFSGRFKPYFQHVHWNELKYNYCM